MTVTNGRSGLRATMLAGAAALTLCGAAQAQAQETQTAVAPAVAARGQTVTVTGGEISAPAVVVGDTPRILGAANLGGLEVFGLDGARQGVVQIGEIIGVDVAYGVDIGGRPQTVVAAIDGQAHALRLFTLDGATLTEVGARAVPLGFAGENVCLFHHQMDGALYAFIVGDGGEVDQQLIYADANGRLDARQSRRINLPSPIKQCAVDGPGARLYVAEEATGVWRFNADPEAFVEPVLIDGPRGGNLSGESGGLALYDGGEGARWLFAADPEGGRINVYDRANDDAYVSSFTVADVEEPGPLAATSLGLGTGLDSGALIVTDEGVHAFRTVAVADIARALGLNVGSPIDPRVHNDSTLATVVATVETAAVPSFGDAADDPAIWAHPTDPRRSLVVATDKQAGLYVYDMAGAVVQFVNDGKMNNVDLRDGFRLGGEAVTLVAASNRTDKSIALYVLDHDTGQLRNVADGVQPTGLEDPYGLCLYREPTSGRAYVFINGDETRKRQWELVDAGNGRVRAEFVRELTFASQTEGCVVDDDAGVLFVNEEDDALWRIGAGPDAGTTLTRVEGVADNPALLDDLEGIALYDLGGGRGYLVSSSQGNNTYAVYDRQAPHRYRGSFAVVADPIRGIDGISETDGLDVTSRNLGPGFEHGAMVAQDGRNVLPTENQNYKYVPWEAIARALNLEMRNPE